MKGHYSKCQEVLTKIAQQNKKEFSDEFQSSIDIATHNNLNNVPVHREYSSNSTGYLILIQNSWLRKRFLFFTALIVYIYLSYNGILFALANIGGNIYINSLVVNIAELLGYISSSKYISQS